MRDNQDEARNESAQIADASAAGDTLSLNDDRRVKVLSPGRLVANRFFRNRTAVVGLAALAFMFLFSFLGGILSPYDEDEIFYRTEYQNKVRVTDTDGNAMLLRGFDARKALEL